jgi:hypothetical protein
MGIWMMIFGISSVASAYFSKLMMGNNTGLGLDNAAFSHWFIVLGSMTVVGAVVVYLFSLVVGKRVKVVT